jgi:hypothetical protein
LDPFGEYLFCVKSKCFWCGRVAVLVSTRAITSTVISSMIHNIESGGNRAKIDRGGLLKAVLGKLKIESTDGVDHVEKPSEN